MKQAGRKASRQEEQKKENDIHINKGIDCVSCHGEIKHMEKVAQMNSFTMSNCLKCHRNAHENLTYIKDVKAGPEYCFACHR